MDWVRSWYAILLGLLWLVWAALLAVNGAMEAGGYDPVSWALVAVVAGIGLLGLVVQPRAGLLIAYSAFGAFGGGLAWLVLALYLEPAGPATGLAAGIINLGGWLTLASFVGMIVGGRQQSQRSRSQPTALRWPEQLPPVIAYLGAHRGRFAPEQLDAELRRQGHSEWAITTAWAGVDYVANNRATAQRAEIDQHLAASGWDHASVALIWDGLTAEQEDPATATVVAPQ